MDDQAWLEDDFIPTVRQRGAAIINARGASSAESLDHAVHLQNSSAFGLTGGIQTLDPCERCAGTAMQIA